MSERAPRTRDDLTFVELDGEGVIYDEANGTLHHLNPSAAIVWSLCDGTGTADDIAAAVADAFDLEGSTVLGQVREVLAVFAESGLIVAG